jgi:hypothetical protein
MFFVYVSSNVTVQFTSNSEITKSGFEITWKCWPDQNSEPPVPPASVEPEPPAKFYTMGIFLLSLS